MAQAKPVLKKALTAIHLWAIAVALVISGEYFGWNYGWGVAGTMGMLIASGAVTVLYVCFIFSFTELTASIPNAGGPFTYAYRALGPIGGLIAGYATLVEFLLSGPAIAYALGSYVHFLYPAVDVVLTAISCYVIFTIINLFGVKESALFTLAITLLAVVELLVFMGIVAPHFQLKNFMHNNMPFGWAGVFAALPYAMWLYLGIEGVAQVAEEVKDPKRNIAKGYIIGIATLVLLALGVLVLAGGITNWENLSAIDYPLPESIGIVMGKDNEFTKLFAGLGLFGLVASFHSGITTFSRQLFSMARENYLPRFLSAIHPRYKVPHWSLLVGSVIGIVAILTGKTSDLIVFSVLGAVVMYIISMISLFILRKKEPLLERPFVTPFYPWFPLLALVLSVVCLVAIIYYNQLLSVYFFAFMLLLVILFVTLGKHKTIR